MSRFVLLLYIFIFSPLFISAQSTLDNLGRMPSPQAADLGRYGDIPMSYYTGRANVAIPLRSFNELGLAMDISLTYDTSGLLMNKHPGWVGPGWTLNAGGCITRVQNNFCDEMVIDAHHPYSNFSNYFHSYDEMVDTSGEPNIEDMFDVSGYGYHDYAPDVFYFNFLGKFGWFFLGNDGEWKVSSEDNLIVEFDYNNDSNYIDPFFTTYPADFAYKQPKAIRGFTMYDDEGYQYTFGCDTSAIEYSIDLFRTTDREEDVPWVATSWFLTKVKDRFGNLLYELEYVRGKFTAQLYHTNFSQTINVTTPSDGWWFFQLQGGHSESICSKGYSGTLNLPVYLRQIRTLGNEQATFYMKDAYNAGTVARHLYPSLYVNGNVSGAYLSDIHSNHNQYQFYYLQSPIDSIRNCRAYNLNLNDDPLCAIDMKLLDSITIQRGTFSDNEKYVLEYDSIGRLHLSNVKVYTNNKQQYAYAFNYNHFNNVPQDYLTDQHDHWGYYNKRYIDDGGQTPILPPEDENYQNNNSPDNPPSTPVINRNPTLSYALCGMLTSIIYPTGGRTEFEYELHDYSSVLSHDRQSMQSEIGVAGGLRIKSMKDKTEGAYTKTRTYEYQSPRELSSGQLFTRPSYHWYWTHGNSSISVTQDAPVIPLCTSFGNHIGYSTVIETWSDGTTHQYQYTNFSDVKDELPIASSVPSLFEQTGVATPYDRFSELGFMRGQLIAEAIMDTNGLLWKDIRYKYRTDSAEYKSEYSYSANLSIISSPSGQASIFGVGNVYKLYYPKYDISEIVSSERYGDVMVTDTISYNHQTFKQEINGWPIRPFFRKCLSEHRTRLDYNVTKSYNYTSNPLAIGFMPLCNTTTNENGVWVKDESTIFGNQNGAIQALHEISRTSGGTDTLITYHSYSARGWLLSYTKMGNYTTHLFWNRCGRITAVVTCPFTDFDTPQESQEEPNTPLEQISPLDVVKRHGQSIFNFPEVKAEAYIYDQAGNMVARAIGNGTINYYRYDSLGRLTEILDSDYHILQRFKYRYYTTSQWNNPIIISPE